MDQDSKKFFEELSGVSSESEEPKTLKVQEEDEDKEEEKGIKSKKNKSVSTEAGKKITTEDIFEETEGQLTIDVYQTPDEIIVESTIAGVNPEDLDISITSESVTIKGKRGKEEIIKDEDYFYQECYWGKFSRSIILPQEIDSEKATAGIKNGILTMHLPKINRQRAKKLKVKFN